MIAFSFITRKKTTDFSADIYKGSDIINIFKSSLPLDTIVLNEFSEFRVRVIDEMLFVELTRNSMKSRELVKLMNYTN